MIDITKFYITDEDLVVGNKLFSLDGGELEIIGVTTELIALKNLDTAACYHYYPNGNNYENSLYPTLFKSNPFTTEIVEEVKTVVEETEHDFYSQLEGFPKEVVEKMLERQVEQGNVKDITVFEKYYIQSKLFGGFDWNHTIEKNNFWNEVIVGRNFNLFFEKYPKLNKKVLIRGDIHKGPEIIAYLEKLGGRNVYNWYGTLLYNFYYINEINEIEYVNKWNFPKIESLSDYTIIEI